MNIERILILWAAFMRAEDLTERTVKDRLQFIRRLGRLHGDPLALTRADLIAYLGTPSWSSGTRQRYRSALHTFYTWLQDEGHRPDNPAARLPRVRHRPKEPNPCTIQDIQELLARHTYRRTKVMILLHFYLGLRVHEVVKVRGDDVDRRALTIRVFGKGKKDRLLPIPDTLVGLLDSMPRAGFWFPNWQANTTGPVGEGHVLSNSASRTISAAMKRAGIRHTAHNLRAATATIMSRQGVDSFTVQRALRHETIATTTRYRLVDLDEVRDGLNRLPVVALPSTSGRAAA